MADTILENPEIEWRQDFQILKDTINLLHNDPNFDRPGKPVSYFEVENFEDFLVWKMAFRPFNVEIKRPV